MHVAATPRFEFGRTERGEQAHQSIGAISLLEKGSVWLMRLDLGLRCTTIASVIRSCHQGVTRILTGVSSIH